MRHHTRYSTLRKVHVNMKQVYSVRTRTFVKDGWISFQADSNSFDDGKLDCLYILNSWSFQ